jgi:NAD(P)-dependent dehydrogenase (short-subunit alcohol dehydrogenase family)
MASAITGYPGNWAGGVRSAGFLDSTAADVDHVFGMNLRGLFCACARGWAQCGAVAVCPQWRIRINEVSPGPVLTPMLTGHR